MIPAEFNGIDHVVLRVADISRSLAFYVDLLGLSLERVLETIGLHQVRCGHNLIDLMPLKPGEQLAEPEQRGIEHLCLRVRGDIDEIAKALEARGVPIISGPMEVYGATGYGTSVYVNDPDGYAIEIKAHYAKRPVRHGAAPKVTANV
jgi:glyoxylase I family protein